MKPLIPLMIVFLASGLFAQGKTSAVAPSASGTAIKLSSMHKKPTLYIRSEGEVVTKKPGRTNEQIMRVYYKYGVYSEMTRYIATGKIIVNFDETKQIDYDAFANKYDLIFEKELNRISKVAVFSVDPSVDVLEKVNAIITDKPENIQHIQPEWIAKFKFQ